MSSMPSSTRVTSCRPLDAGRQVDLGDVARDHHLRAEAETGQEHLHLLGRGVLRLVEHDERVVQRAAAHVGERGDLDRRGAMSFGTSSGSIISLSASYSGRRYGSILSVSVPGR